MDSHESGFLLMIKNMMFGPLIVFFFYITLKKAIVSTLSA